jgi:hypothetical protein
MIRQVEQPTLKQIDDNGRSEFAKVGAFSPDGRQVTVSIASWEGGKLLIIEVATGQVLTEMTTNDLFEETGRNYALMPEWTATGLLLYPHCFPCEGFVEGLAYRWQPETGNITQTAIPYRVIGYGLISDRLHGTGEIIMPAQDEAYPARPGPMIDFNVLVYQNPSTDQPGDSRVIYVNPAEPAPVLVPRWVADGRAYLIHNAERPTATLVWRDGTLETVELDTGRTLLSGTPEGWLMHDDTGFYAYVIGESGALQIERLPYQDKQSAPEKLQNIFLSERSALGERVTLRGVNPVIRGP